ncbi:hypothetical protein NL676_004553 [Syzygium grande]|nr:hypothetical protein NL676_004553 [Syzygium grande]
MKSLWENGYLHCEKDCLKSSNKTSKQILLFNCMDVRDPQILLPRLVNICASSGTHFSKALSLACHHIIKEATGASIITSDIPTTRDLSGSITSKGFGRRLYTGKMFPLTRVPRRTV